MNRKTFAAHLPVLLAVILVLLGMGLRIQWMNQSALWCDEAESSINALTILQTGVPGWKYLGLPVYENTLSEPWEEHPEYEFRDSSYSLKQGVTVYHGWLPLYAIAFSQWIFGMTPDVPVSPPRVLHAPGEIDRRTTIPRLPALIFSLACLVVVARLGWAIGGPACGLGALTLMALNARTVDFGIQARYYSLTLLVNCLAAWFLWRAATRGKWRDYLLLGLAAASLFHTHLFSFVVFSLVAVTAAPFMARRRGWWIKAGSGASLALALILPWVLLSGFLQTADSVPKVFRLFDSLWDALAYAVDRPVPLLIIFLLTLLLALARLRPHWMEQSMGSLGKSFQKHYALYVILLFWMAAAYAAFHLIVPAASFFFERLSLVLWTPFVLIVALLVSDLLSSMDRNRAAVFAVLIMVALLVARGRLAFFEETSISQERKGVAALMEALAAREFCPGTRFYATPNEHLTWTYYTGLPVQSVAPVRREFFATYPGPVVFIESQMDAFFPSETSVHKALLAEGIPVSAEATWEVQQAVWEALATEDLQKRGIIPLTKEEIWENRSFQKVKEVTRRDFLTYQAKYLRNIQASPVLRGTPATSIKEIWLGFFYRFVNPEERLGVNFNLLPRLRTAGIEFLPRAQIVLYFSEGPTIGHERPETAPSSPSPGNSH